MPRPSRAIDAMRRVRECHESIESARACVERAETAAASATRAIERAKFVLARLRLSQRRESTTER